MGVPEGPDCTGSTVTEPLRCGAACADPQAEKPVGGTRENLHQTTIQRSTGYKNGNLGMRKVLEASDGRGWLLKQALFREKGRALDKSSGVMWCTLER